MVATEGISVSPQTYVRYGDATVGLPSFEGRGVLPPTADGSPYSCELAEMRSRFVEDLASPAWRLRLMNGWTNLASVVWDACPSSYWWVWGPFVTATQLPRFGDEETLTALVFLPVSELIVLPEHHYGLLMHALQAAISLYSVNAGWVYEHPPDDAVMADMSAVVESKWRPRATHSPIDDDSLPVGFIEVRK